MIRVASVMVCPTLLLAMAARPVQSQDYVYSAGDPTFAVNIPVENGFINIANGNLHLEFTLASHKQRGALSLDEKLVYDSRIWKIIEDQAGYHSWQPINIPYSNGGWRFVAGNETGTINETPGPTNTFICPGGYGASSEYQTQYYYSWTDPQGTEHQFDVVWTVNIPNGSCPAPPNPESTSGLSLDSTGYTMQLTGDDSSSPVVSVFDSQGTQVYPQLMDRYGNYFSNDGSGNLVDDLGRTPVVATTNGNVTDYAVLSVGGARKHYTVTMEPLLVNTQFNEQGVTESTATTMTAVQSIELPDGNKYTFTYDSGTSPGNYGELTSVTLPTGGIINYGWSSPYDSYSNVNRWLSSRSLGPNLMKFHLEAISACNPNSTGCQEQHTLTKPSGDETVYLLTLNNGAWNTTTTVYNGAATNNHSYVQIANTYDFTKPCGATCTGSQFITKSDEATTLTNTGLVALRQYGYANNQTGLLQWDKEWDYYAGSSSTTSQKETTTPTRQVSYGYTSAGNGGFLVSTETINGSAGAQVAQTTYNYSSTSVPTSNIPQHLVQAGPYLQSVSRWLNTSNAFVNQSYKVYDTGMIQSATDADNNPPTTNGYDPTGTFVTSVTRPVTNGIAHVSQAGYDFSSGLITSETNENNQTITHTYYTSGTNLGKPYQVLSPDGGSKTYTYPSPTEVDTAATVNSTLSITSSQSVDAFGRPYQTSDGGGSSETMYDGNGRVYSVTNKHLASAQPTDGTTTYGYDGLDRVTSVTPPGSSSFPSSYGYVDNTVGLSGALRQKNYQYNAFHQLVTAQDAVMQAVYQYDGLGNVICVQENGSGGCATNSPANGGQHMRFYLYDSLSRLIQSYAPESGFLCYGTTAGNAPATWTNCTPGYDGNGRILHKTDSRGTTTNYTYDMLGRLTAKTFTNAPAGTLSSCFNYDTSPNGIGLPAAEWTTAGSCGSGPGNTYRTMRSHLSYDSMGRTLNETQCVLASCTLATATTPCQQGTVSGIAYCYDWMGHQTYSSNGVNSASYMSGSSPLVFTGSFDQAGRLSSLASNYVDSTHPAALFTADPSAGYTPAGGLHTFTLGGSNVSVSRSYDDRFRVTGQTVTHP